MTPKLSPIRAAVPNHPDDSRAPAVTLPPSRTKTGEQVTVEKREARRPRTASAR